MKQAKKDQAILLRLKGGSVKEISRTLGVAQSTVSVWLRSVELSSKARQILQKKSELGRKKASLTLRLQTEGKLISAAYDAASVVKEVKYDVNSLKILCAMMYWCEGSKTKNDSSLVFTNSDPELVSFFLQLLRKAFGVDESKFRILMHLHEYHNPIKQLRFWSKVTNIQQSQFLRSYKKPNTGKNKKNGYPGCISLRYHDVELAREIQALARMVMMHGPIV